MRIPDFAIEIGAWMLETGHRIVLKLTGGRFPKRLARMQTLELHTIGRKSQLRRSTMLTAPLYAPDRLVVVASKGGHSDHPDWYKNLAVNPDVEVTIGKDTRPMTARTASADEKAVLWPQIVKAYRMYAGYQLNTKRDIPVVICTPR
ncbi:hypothetical protein GOEFS_064_00120 [Gordonia effusa NBRC 100432]|uniref:Nitroreductase n=1 Tax=Gordonia effusa NBRC 100432 TaxID=1077974 RepID=H0R122_9ACTN|nr:nitroreductase/quinone reductase family protein [Gordonia effusa]GAB18773.1 hypothetical protein GOEFS_064_00120 [Gordonia effusa NBRC 100432]